jgi:hypothetical protein
MTDLEICKRIAEIEGLNVAAPSEVASREYLENVCVIIPEGEYHPQSYCYNPLTDKALCFDLMVKHKLSLIAPEGEQEDWDCVIRDVLTVHKSPNRAICLAIIEAHKNE